MEYLKVFPDFLEDLEPLTDDEVGRLFRAMLQFVADGTTPDLAGNERFLWPTARKNILRVEEYLAKKREVGAKGGRPKKNQTKPNETKQNQTKPTETSKDKEKEKDNISLTDVRDNTRHRYGEYKNVLLSDADIDKLKTEFPNDYLDRIERLSEYIAKTGKAYKSHLATIRSWARADKKTPEQDERDKRNEWMRKYIRR